MPLSPEWLASLQDGDRVLVAVGTRGIVQTYTVRLTPTEIWAVNDAGHASWRFHRQDGTHIGTGYHTVQLCPYDEARALRQAVLSALRLLEQITPTVSLNDLAPLEDMEVQGVLQSILQLATVLDGLPRARALSLKGER